MKKMINTNDVIKELEKNHGYDFNSDWWTDELKAIMSEIITACDAVVVRRDDEKKELLVDFSQYLVKWSNIQNMTYKAAEEADCFLKKTNNHK